MQAATKVGVLVVAFILLLYGAYALLGRSLFAEPHATYYADFQDASGIVPGSQVLMAGLEVGTVTEAKLAGPRMARITMEIRPDVRVPFGSEAVIPGSLLSLTQGQILITPPEGPIKGYDEPGTVMRGRKGNALEENVPGAKDAVAELTKTIKATRELIEDQEMRGDIKNLLKTSNATLKQFGALSSQTQGMLAENRVLINQSLRSAMQAMRDVQESTQIVVSTLKKGHVEEKTSEMLDRLNETSAKAEHLVASLDDLISDKGTQSNLKTTIQNAATISDSGTRIAKSTEVIAKNGEQVSAKAVEIADKANALADEAKSTLEDIRGVFGKGHPAPLSINGEMDVLHQTEPDYWRTDVVFSTFAAGTGYHVGLWDAFGSNKLIVQLGHNVTPNLYYRYGIYAAKPGIGVDYHFNDRLSMRGDLFDLNDPRLDLKLRIGLGRGVFGWLGGDRILDHARPTIGIGFQK